jgi:transketolase
LNDQKKQGAIDTINAAAVFGQAFVEMAKEDKRIIFISADSFIGAGAAKFKEMFPDRFFEFGIAEQNACSHAAGMALMGMKPFFASIATFATMRCFEQIRDDLAREKLNVVIIGRGAGLSYSMQGPTHVSFDEIGLLRTLPNMTIIDPCDASEFKQALRCAVALSGPVYIREHKYLPKKIQKEDDVFEVGKAKIVRKGSDLSLITCGVSLHRVMTTAQILEDKGIYAEVIHMPTIKPIDQKTILHCVHKTGMAVTVEEHSILNGLGSAVTEVVSETCIAKVKRIGLNDLFPIEGPYEKVIDFYRLDSLSMAEDMERFFLKEKMGKGQEKSKSHKKSIWE